MNADMANARWSEMRGSAQQTWGRLTNSDLDQVEGQYSKLVGLVQDRYGYSRSKAQREVSRFLDRHGMSTGDLQAAGNSILGTLRHTVSNYPWAFIAGAVVLALAVTGFIWKPYHHKSGG